VVVPCELEDGGDLDAAGHIQPPAVEVAGEDLADLAPRSRTFRDHVAGAVMEPPTVDA
jgi:hypothetical protein